MKSNFLYYTIEIVKSSHRMKNLESVISNYSEIRPKVSENSSTIMKFII